MKQHATGATRSPITGTSDADEFQMPLPGLYADLELGRGSLRLEQDFLDCPSLVKLELIRDWQRSLARYRQDALTQFAAELTGGAAGLEANERLDLFRSTCRTLRLDVPSGFDALTAMS
jgi:hypothetical protein